MSVLWGALAALVLGVGLARRAALRRSRVRGEVDDDAVRRIEREGAIAYDPEAEPLDMDEIARAEEEFWSETWDVPDEMDR